jgi:hypothetical protein
MTEDLRDRFAMAVLTGLMASEDYGPGQNYYRGPDGERYAAQRAYSLADAMLAARAREGGAG